MISIRSHISQKKILSQLTCFSVLLVMFSSLNIYPTWYISKSVLLVVSLFVISLHFFVNRKLFVVKSTFLLPILLFLCLKIFLGLHGNLNSMVVGLLSALFIVLILCLEDSLKKRIFSLYKKMFFFILLVSLIFWIPLILGVKFPFFNCSFNDEQYVFNNYGFFLVSVKSNSLILRFQSLFLEPGHLGIFVSFLLLTNKYNFKKSENWVFFISILLSFSMAAYVLTFVGFYCNLLWNSQKRFLILAMSFGILCLSTLFFINYKNGQNAVMHMVILRFKYAGEGEIIKDNRNTDSFRQTFDSFMESQDKWLGIGEGAFQSLKLRSNSGYRVFVLQYGILALLLLFLAYLSVTFYWKSSIGYILFFIYCLSFYQRPYAIWDVQIIFYILALNYLKKHDCKQI